MPRPQPNPPPTIGHMECGICGDEFANVKLDGKNRKYLHCKACGAHLRMDTAQGQKIISEKMKDNAAQRPAPKPVAVESVPTKKTAPAREEEFVIETNKKPVKKTAKAKPKAKVKRKTKPKVEPVIQPEQKKPKSIFDLDMEL